jgi:hypothetical protein
MKYLSTNSIYSAAVVSFSNGSTIEIALVPGDDEYKALMYRVSLDSYKHFAPPYSRVLNEWLLDLPRQELRKLRKRIGLPASTDARILGTMAATLKSKTEEVLGHKISIVAGSFPKFVALYDEEVLDGFEWIGLQYRQIFSGRTCLSRQISSVYAAAGFGLCSHYKNTDLCVEKLFSSVEVKESILTVSFSTNALIVEWPLMVDAYLWLPGGTGMNIHNFSLGLSAATAVPDYWQVLQNTLEEVFVRYDWRWKMYPPRKIFVTGESGDNGKFLRILKEACGRQGNKPVIYKNDVLFSSARGTAELGKRAEYLSWKDLHPPHESLGRGREEIRPAGLGIPKVQIIQTWIGVPRFFVLYLEYKLCRKRPVL